MIQAFRANAAPVKVTVSGSASTAVELGDNPETVRIANTGTATVWIKFGNKTVAAATTDFPVPAGVVEVIRPNTPERPVYVSAIAAGSTGDIYFNAGSGI